MPTYKYTVANKEGKKLNGVVEAPNETTARNELNNLNFSVLSLMEVQPSETESKNQLPKFVFEAYDKRSQFVSGTIPAQDSQKAFDRLQKEYNLMVTAIWKEGATKEEIEKARKNGVEDFKEQFERKEDLEKSKNDLRKLQDKKEAQIVQTKVEYVLKKVNEILQEHDKSFNNAQKTEINKRINQILRIKNSSNLAHILNSAEDLLKYIQSQEKEFQKKGLRNKQIKLTIQTSDLLDSLKRGQSKKQNKITGLFERLTDRLDNLDQTLKEPSFFVKKLRNLSEKLKDYFTTPLEISYMKEEISTYNKQLWQFAMLYFKEPTKEYKDKIKRSISTIWKMRKSSIQKLKNFKKERKLKTIEEDIQNEESVFFSITKEICHFSGWLLGFYIFYYFLSIYLTSKNFDLGSIPKGFYFYESHIFKYALSFIFLLHITTSLKINFFKNSNTANLILIPFFLIASIISLLNT
ncbi:hypothetical protein KJ632_05530 [Patescibacteria group bacterium]|nr:hypothetical protein [Patescibacteria group bacterium]